MKQHKQVTLNADGTPRKKYVSKKMQQAANRKKGQKKAWDTRRLLYPETNGFKPKMVDESKVEAKKAPVKQKQDVKEKSSDIITEDIKDKLNELDGFVNSVPGASFDIEKFIQEALLTAINTVYEGVIGAVIESQSSKSSKGGK